MILSIALYVKVRHCKFELIKATARSKEEPYANSTHSVWYAIPDQGRTKIDTGGPTTHWWYT